MKLLVIILCLLSERYLLHSLSSHRFHWFPKYANQLLTWVKSYPYLSSPVFQIAALVMPIFLVVGFIYIITYSIFYGFIGFLLNLFILYYCFGLQNIFYPSTSSHDTAIEDQVSAYFSDINPHMFSLVFWYLVGGPLAALLYRLITLTRTIPELNQISDDITDILEWVPARIMMMVFLFVGNFQKGFPYFLEHLLAPPSNNTKIIGGCAMLALVSSDGEDVSLAAAERFMEYALTVFLVFIAIFTLIAWI